MTTATYASTLGSLALEEDRIVVLTAENRAPLVGLQDTLGERFVDVGIAEQTMVGAASGLAIRGRIPVAHALAAFLTMRPFEFIRTDVGLPNLPVKLVGYIPGVLSEANGPTHQALEDVALMRGIPNMGIFCPSDDEDLLLGLADVLRSARPFYVRLNQRTPFRRHGPFDLGKAELLSIGSEIGLLAYGTLVTEAAEATEILVDQGLTVGLLNLRTLEPLDTEAVVSIAKATRLLVTVEDHFRTGGLYSMISELLVERGIRTRLFSISFPGRWFRPGRLGDVLRHERLTGEDIAERVLEAWAARRSHT
jgi:transketolase